MECRFCDQSNVEFVEVFGYQGECSEGVAVKCLDCQMQGPAADDEEHALEFWDALYIQQMGSPYATLLSDFMKSMPALDFANPIDLVVSTWIASHRATMKIAKDKLQEAKNILEASLPFVEAMVGIGSGARGLPELINEWIKQNGG